MLLIKPTFDNFDVPLMSWSVREKICMTSQKKGRHMIPRMCFRCRKKTFWVLLQIPMYMTYQIFGNFPVPPAKDWITICRTIKVSHTARQTNVNFGNNNKHCQWWSSDVIRCHCFITRIHDVWQLCHHEVVKCRQLDYHKIFLCCYLDLGHHKVVMFVRRINTRPSLCHHL